MCECQDKCITWEKINVRDQRDNQEWTIDTGNACISVQQLGDLFQEEFEDTKVIIRIHKSKDRQHYGRRKKYNRTNDDLHSPL